MLKKLLELIRTGNETNIELALEMDKSLKTGLTEMAYQLLDEGCGGRIFEYSISQRLSYFFKSDTIDMSYRRILEPPELIYEANQVENLIFNQCSIIKLSEKLQKLKNLTSLDVSGNPIEKLPDSIVNLKRLENIYQTWKYY